MLLIGRSLTGGYVNRAYIAWRKHSKDSTRFLGYRRWEKRPRLDQMLSLEVNDEILDYTYFCLISRWKK